MVPAATAILLLMLALLAPSAASAQRTRSVPLAPADIDAIVQLVKLEDTRTFDDAVLTRLVNAAAVQPLLRMTEDKSLEVRFWAVRGLSPAAVAPGKPIALRITALTPLAALAPDAAKDAATAASAAHAAAQRG